MVGGLIPASAVPINTRFIESADQRGCHPDVIETAAAIRGGPVASPVAPPSVKAFLRRHEVPHGIDKATGLPQAAKALNLDRGMADHRQQLLVRPDVGI